MNEPPLLLQLRLRGRVPDSTSDEGAALVVSGHATVRKDHLVLTRAGRAAADVSLRLSGPEEIAARTAYEQFLPRNVELIQACNDWQVRPGGVHNDHRDPTYDWSVIDRLATIDDRVGPLIKRLGRAIDHFDGYRPRLRGARTQLENGDRDWFTSPRIDSYHAVWMELHEHLLVALGIERSAESAEVT